MSSNPFIRKKFATVPGRDRVVCQTPTPGKQPVSIDAWKYEVVRDAVLAVLPVDGPGVRFQDLPGLIASQMAPDAIGQLGSLSWYATTVKLDLEVRGLVRRLPGSPQRLVRRA
ncbi:MAG: hypothetical protein JNM76_07155 [Betaproteobacteria bacterium]|nr:hypothetical protein [Betaproteobacteria bacterium]